MLTNRSYEHKEHSMNRKFLAIALVAVMIVGSIFAFAGCDNGNEQLIGFDTDLAKAVAEELGVNVKFQLIAWKTKEVELETKKIDLIWNGLTIDEDRKAQMEISNPYLNNIQVAVIRKADSSKYTSADSIANAKVAFESGSAGATYAENNGFKNVNKMEAQMDALTEVLTGKSDVAILDSTLANFYLSTGKTYSSLTILDLDDATPEQYGVAARKGDKGTMDKINTALAKLANNGKLEEIAKKYGLEKILCLDELKGYESKWDTLTAEEKSGWEYIEGKGNFIVGYTLYAPIAYMG